MFEKTGFLFTITMGQDRYRLVSPNASPEARLSKGPSIKKDLWRHLRGGSGYFAWLATLPTSTRRWVLMA